MLLASMTLSQRGCQPPETPLSVVICCAGDYLAAFNHVLLPIAYEYAPDLIIASAGFDAAERDPIGGCHVTPDCFAHMTALLQPVAPLAVLLEVCVCL